MTRAVGYAYPWDFTGDPAAAPRARALGLDAVAVAAAYHTVRAAAPLHPARRLVEARHAACYVPVREEAWRGRRLRPAQPSWPGPEPDDDLFGHARDALRPAGLDVYAWAVLTHNSLLGRANPDLTVRNAFGEHYSYALCPSAREVVDYCATLVREIVAAARPDGLVLEACGPLGVVHGGHHDKTDLSGWTAVQQQLLSLCFCAGCTRRYADAGIDAAQAAQRVRDALGAGGAGPPESVHDALGARPADALAGVRARVVRALRARVAAEARAVSPGLRLVLHASADPWATGPFATVDGGLGTDVDVLVGRCWDSGPGGARGLRALAHAADEHTAVGGYLLADGSWQAADAAERLRDYLAAGMDELHLYHLGLAGAAGRQVMARLVAAAQEAARPAT
ncbi:MAG TPA: hypothetical protein VFH77_00895 [Streptomyces sp.]|nr:hypothetical protein [Streptomyces sp.]